jgi:dethiobiotin synthetase
MKPVETGVGLDGATWSDAEKLQQAAGTTDPMDMISPYRFSDPIAPLSAARRAGCHIEPHRLLHTFAQLAARHRLMLVEGIGGIRVPLSDTWDNTDLAAALALPVLVVGRAELGGVNHALLTLDALHHRNLCVLAVALIRRQPDADCQSNPAAELQEETTVELLKEQGRVRVIGPLRHEKELQRDWLHGLRQLTGDSDMHTLVDLIMTSVS